jgi:hypothetical protein
MNSQTRVENTQRCSTRTVSTHTPPEAAQIMNSFNIINLKIINCLDKSNINKVKC